MDEKTELTRESVLRELEAYPSAVSEEFDRSWKAMASSVNERQLADWAGLGLRLAGETIRSWEAAAEYFAASPRVVGLMPFNYFVRWAESGRDLCSTSPVLGAAYYRASPGVMSRLRSRHIESWAAMGRSLYRGTWKSGALSTKFFESSPSLLGTLTVPELERFVALLGLLSHRSYDLAGECISSGLKIFPQLGDEKGAFLSMASSLASGSWRQVKSLFEAASRSLPKVEPGQRQRFLELVDKLREAGANAPASMIEISSAMSELDKTTSGELLGLAERLADVSPQAVPSFVRSSPPVLEKVSMSQMERWFDQGLATMQENADAGMSYFRLESSRSLEVLETLSSSVELTRIKDLMERYCKALAGADVELCESRELADRHIGWVSEESPSTEGTAVYVPSVVDRYPSKARNFTLYKVVSTHQVGHLEFGSFLFEYDRPSTRFEDLRPTLDAAERSGAGEDGGGGWVTDMQRFFDMFANRKLALDIFTVVEDGRLDALVKVEYLGIRADYAAVQADSIPSRPAIESLPAQEALVELLVRISLDQKAGLAAPAKYASHARRIARIAERVIDAEATVEDTAEATIRIYAILDEIPNEQVAPEDWEDMDADADEEDDLSPEEIENLLEQMMGVPADAPGGDASESDYEQVRDVDYRGQFKPETVQLLSQLRASRDESAEGGGEPLSQEALEELLASSAEVDMQAAEGDAQDAGGEFAENMLKEAGLTAPRSPDTGQGPLTHVEEGGGPLDATEPETFVYDEWDFRADDYKPNWCVVRQKGMAEGDPTFYGTTLQSYGSLVNQVKRQFEMMTPEMFKKVRKLEDGEEIDIDDVIEAVVDIKTGAGPSEKLYWKRNKVQRDVAVVFLLDTSASTAEAIEDTRKAADDWQAPDDPVEYMTWLRNRRGDGMRRSYKRIIDVEKEAVVLLINALESIGDQYGIYGFSGYGRENVEFYTVKDISEALSQSVKNRIDRIAPLHATRMGPAIRHATSKLDGQDARTKLLFLISDGRPQDRGYSREGVEKEYAVHDTKMALDEARDKDINAFCLTVDKSGHDYLKYMCQDMGYEILENVYELPQRLLYLYKRLTM